MITGYNPTTELFKHKESSSLVTERERNSLTQQWKSQRRDAFRSDKSGRLLSQIKTQVARLEQKLSTNSGMHPFKIYQFPNQLRRFQNDDDWRRFKIRDATVTYLGSPVTEAVWGSDLTTESRYIDPFGDEYGLFGATQLPPSDSSQTSTDGSFSFWNEVAIPADGHLYHFWFSLVLPVAGGSWGGISKNAHPSGIAFASEDDPTNAKIMLTLEPFDNTKVWSRMPISDPYNYYIGSVVVDNGSLAAAFPGFPRITVSQGRADNLEIPSTPYGSYSASGGSRVLYNFRGDYDGSTDYYVGDVVTITYADGTGVSSLYQYIYDPPSTASLFHPINIPGPMTGTSPNGNSPDPWKLLSKSPVGADYISAAFDPSKKYLRTA